MVINNVNYILLHILFFILLKANKKVKIKIPYLNVQKSKQKCVYPKENWISIEISIEI